MRRTVALAAALMMVLMVGLFGYYAGWRDGAGEDTSTTYTAPATVVEVDKESKWVTLVDWNGEAWCIRDDSFVEGEQVKGNLAARYHQRILEREQRALRVEHVVEVREPVLV